MLSPESNRSSLPFVASVTIQCSLVLLLALPWTVQTLRNRTSFQLPVLLNLQPLKPVQATKAPPPQNGTNNSLSMPARQIRAFYAPSMKSNNSTADSSTTAPEITLDPGVPVGFGEAAHISDVLVRSSVGPAPSPTIPPTTEAPERVISVGGKIQAAKLIRQVQPNYPALARQVRVQGVVTLEAIIGIDGAIQQLRVLNGHPLLVASAVQAVQQWMYSPTVLNGKAVEVKTTIEVRFTLF